MESKRHVIVIAQRGWIFEGWQEHRDDDVISLKEANVVRRWSNGRGIGGLVKAEYKHEYTLDPVGSITFAPGGVIAVIDIEW